LSVVRNASQPTKLSIKYADEATNAVIKESFLYTKAENITKDGVYSFVSTDGASYTFQVSWYLITDFTLILVAILTHTLAQVTTWTDLTKTINWRVFVVSRNFAYYDSSLDSVIDVDQLGSQLSLSILTSAISVSNRNSSIP
jgi:hypothetical protein